MNIFKIHIRANVNTYRGADYQWVSMYVLSEPDKIKELILAHSEEVYKYFDKKRCGTKRLVAFPIKKNLFINDLGSPELFESNGAFSMIVLTENGFDRIEIS